MVVALLLFLNLAFSYPLVLSTDANEGAFAIREVNGKLCVVGRIDSEERGYDALVGVIGEEFYRVSSPDEDYSYTLERFGNLCLAGITTMHRGNMDMVLVIFGKGSPEVILSIGGKGDDMLWFMKRVRGGYLLVGGVYVNDWDILVIKLSDDLKKLWHLRLGTHADEYAYGVVEREGYYYVVGRSNYRSDWDGFVLKLSTEGVLKEANLLGSDRKDYFRYTGLFDGSVILLGRTEIFGESDVLLCVEKRTCYAYDVGEFDYGRVFVPWSGGLALMGDTYEEGQSDGLLMFLDRRLEPKACFSLGGENIESVRFLIPEGWFAGYTYSFSLDNDLMIGKIGELSSAPVRRKACEKKTLSLRVYSYPLKKKSYRIEKLSLNLSFLSLTLRTIKIFHTVH